jgi:hypothetical protein
MRSHHQLALGLLLAICLSQLPTQAADSDLEFRATVSKLYAFEPHKLSEREMNSKSNELDRFWDIVKAEPATYLPRLRQLLSETSHPDFFYYDASKLLLSLSESSADQALAALVIGRADLRGIQHTDYLKTIHRLASNGHNTKEAAFRILAYPEFKAFIPQHALTLGQNYSLIYALFQMDENEFIGELIRRLDTEQDAKSQKSILLALWYAATPDATNALTDYASAQERSDENRAYAAELLKRRPPFGSGIGVSSVQKLRDERRRVMSQPISDEALIEFDRLTAKIIARK